MELLLRNSAKQKLLKRRKPQKIPFITIQEGTISHNINSEQDSNTAASCITVHKFYSNIVMIIITVVHVGFKFRDI